MSNQTLELAMTKLELDMVKGLTEYMLTILKDYNKWVAQSPTEVRIRMAKEFEDSLRYEIGSKYIKIISNSSAHSFIVKKDGGKFKQGDILKANSWKAPATNFVRGNILNNQYGAIAWTGA
jgi:exosome complex RNA-binding protein Csl4